MKAQTQFDHMSNGQLRTNAINDPRVLEAMSAVPRERFVPEAFAGAAYVDNEIPLGQGRYLIEPLVFATLLQLANVSTDDTVLVIGGGLGYSAAVLARLAREVVMAESVDERAIEARGLLSGQGSGNIEVVSGPLASGAPGRSPYDVILLEGAAEEIPESLLTQLREGGRLVGLRAVSTRQASALCEYVVIERLKTACSERREGSAFAHLLPGFEKKPVFSL